VPSGPGRLGCSAISWSARRPTPRCRPGPGAGWCVLSLPASTPTRAGVGCGFPATPWTGGSGPGAAVGLTPWSPAPGSPVPRLPVEVIEIAVALKRENPPANRGAGRSGAAHPDGLGAGRADPATSLRRPGPDRARPGRGRVGVRPVSSKPANELWTGDALHGPVVGGRKTYLFAFIDDYSRAVVGHRFGYAEDTVRLAAALRPALGSRGVPESIYVDNGSAFVDAWLLRACATLGIKLTHSTPGRPQGRGKIERFFRTVREQFLVEITGAPETPGRHHVTDLLTLNRLLSAWVETVYHTRIHSETGAAPLPQWMTGGPVALPTPAALAEAFLWEERRSVTKTATVSLHGNTYEVDPTLVGRRVELVFDPFDLSQIEVRYHGAPMGLAVPHRIGRHSHPKARPETPPETPKPTGIDYAQLIDTTHTQQLQQQINYAALLHTTIDQAADETTNTTDNPGPSHQQDTP
jgi:putative transposase